MVLENAFAGLATEPKQDEEIELLSDFAAFQAHTLVLLANTDTPITFDQPVRVVKIKNWNTSQRLLAKNSAIADLNDVNATRIGVAPIANLPCVDWFPYTGSALHLMCAGTAEVSLEGYF